VLLVEDQLDDEELSLAALRRSCENPVVVARDGVEALDYLFGPERVRPLPQLVLLDLHLPRVEGLEVLRRIRADPRTRLLPVVVISGSDEQQDLVRSLEAGANSYVHKPDDPERYQRAIGLLASYWLTLNEPLSPSSSPSRSRRSPKRLFADRRRTS
jgi:two-component system response regulator